MLYSPLLKSLYLPNTSAPRPVLYLKSVNTNSPDVPINIVSELLASYPISLTILENELVKLPIWIVLNVLLLWLLKSNIDWDKSLISFTGT